MQPSSLAGTGLNPPAGLCWRRSRRAAWRWSIPVSCDESDDDLSGITHFILIDGTWHEARKIHQRSPYLQKVRRVSLKPAGTSRTP